MSSYPSLPSQYSPPYIHHVQLRTKLLPAEGRGGEGHHAGHPGHPDPTGQVRATVVLP